MKQINYLLLATILFFSNCSNDLEEIVKITEADLVGIGYLNLLNLKVKLIPNVMIN